MEALAIGDKVRRKNSTVKGSIILLNKKKSQYFVVWEESGKTDWYFAKELIKIT